MPQNKNHQRGRSGSRSPRKQGKKKNQSPRTSQQEQSSSQQGQSSSQSGQNRAFAQSTDSPPSYGSTYQEQVQNHVKSTQGVSFFRPGIDKALVVSTPNEVSFFNTLPGYTPVTGPATRGLYFRVGQSQESAKTTQGSTYDQRRQSQPRSMQDRTPFQSTQTEEPPEYSPCPAGCRYMQGLLRSQSGQTSRSTTPTLNRNQEVPQPSTLTGYKP